jgi:hypothetical protein
MELLEKKSYRPVFGLGLRCPWSPVGALALSEYVFTTINPRAVNRGVSVLTSELGRGGDCRARSAVTP